MSTQKPDMALIKAFCEYRWRELWRAVNVSQASPLQRSIRAYFCASWWHDEDSARDILGSLAGQRGREVLFFRTLTYAFLADLPKTQESLAQLKRASPATWMEDWLSLELAGRSRDLGKVALLLPKICKQHRDALWPYVVCIQLLGQKNLDTSPLLDAVAQLENPSPLRKLLFAQLQRLSGKNAYNLVNELANQSSVAQYEVLTLVEN